MIDSGALERAERVLTVVHGQGIERQLEALRVDRDAFDSFIYQTKQVVKERYPDMWASMDPRLEAALNTILGHSFMIGLVAGRDSERGIL